MAFSTHFPESTPVLSLQTSIYFQNYHSLTPPLSRSHQLACAFFRRSFASSHSFTNRSYCRWLLHTTISERGLQPSSSRCAMRFLVVCRLCIRIRGLSAISCGE
uniref:(northern house mosquito) hypothetical protein n=1 Tax=Culex pipiens TaxID=7175 RepID=A0A8D8ES67_CULPI